MTIHLECYPCLISQLVRLPRMIGLDEAAHKRVFHAMLKTISEYDPENTYPGEMLVPLQLHFERETGKSDPLADIKKRATDECLAMVPELEKKILASHDPFETAVRIAIAGNIIDIGPVRSYDLPDVVERALKEPLAMNRLPQLRAALDKADWVLMLGDNAGETVFDRFLIQAIGKRVVYAVKERPVTNDATMDDARAAGLHEVAELVSSGSTAPGTIEKYCTPQFIELLHSAPLVIAKGMANFETLWESMPSAYYLLQVKCAINAGLVGVPQGSFVVAGGNANAG